MMIEIFNALLKAYKDNDAKMIKHYKKILYSVCYDEISINVILNSLHYNNL